MSKPKRSSKFSKSEEEKLVKSVLEKKHIFENKKTDAVISKQKDSAWERVAQQFSASPNNKIRTAKALKEKYNNIKRTIRRTTANNRRELFLTGGGPSPKQDKENINPVLDELSDVMVLSVDGLPSRQDDDNIFENIINQAAVTEYSEDIIEYEFLNDEKIDEDADISFNGADSHTIRRKDEMMVPPKDWGTYNPSMLRSKQNDLLKMPKIQNQKVAIGPIEI